MKIGGNMKKKLINFFAWFVGIFAIIGGFIWALYKYSGWRMNYTPASNKPDWQAINKELLKTIIKQSADETVKSFKDMFGG
jgi:hypothetical protein